MSKVNNTRSTLVFNSLFLQPFLVIVSVAGIFSASPASAQAGDDEHSAAIREYLKVSGAELSYPLIQRSMVDASINAGRELLGQSLQQKPIQQINNNTANQIVNKHFADYAAAVQKKLSATYTWQKIITDIHIPNFRKTFTLSELRTAIAYYKSPVGRKFVEKTPELYNVGTKQMFDAYREGIQAEIKPIAEEMVAKIRAELEKEAAAGNKAPGK